MATASDATGCQAARDASTGLAPDGNGMVGEV